MPVSAIDHLLLFLAVAKVEAPGLAGIGLSFAIFLTALGKGCGRGQE